MKITSFEIEQFGLWSGLNVPKLSDGINVFYGANETGKSTVLEFVRSQLYGFTGERKRFVRKPSNNQTAWNSEFDADGKTLFQISGGTLQMEAPSGQYKLRRMYYPENIGNEENIELQTLAGEKQGSQLLRVLVAGVDESTFNNVFAIGLDELQKLASLSDTEAAELLFRLSVGLERVSIVDAIKNLTSRRNRILDVAETEGKSSQLALLLRQREKIVDDLSNSKQLVRQYVQLRNEQRVLDRSIANLEEDLAKWEREKRLYEIATAARPIWERRDLIRDTISAMGQVVVVTDDTLTELDAIENELTKQRTAYETAKKGFQKAKDEIAALPIDAKLSKLAPRIEILLEEEDRIVELDAEVSKLNAEITDFNTKIAAEEGKIRQGRRTIPTNNPASSAAAKTTAEQIGTEQRVFGSETQNVAANQRTYETVKAERLEEYRSFAKAVNKTNRRLLRTKEQYADLLGRSKTLNEKIKGEAAKRDVKDISEAVALASEAVNQLKRRQAIGQKIAEMAVHHKELRRINAFLIQNQALPPWMLGLMIVAIVIGSVCVAVGFFPASFKIDSKLAPVAIIAGCLIASGAVASKIFSERNNAKKLERNQRQLGLLTQQLDHAKQEAAAIDSRHPAVGSATIEVRLNEALTELSYLEKLLPVDTQRRDIGQRAKQLEVRLEHRQSEQIEATRRWNDWLRNVGLPNDWTPARIRDFLAHCDVVGDLKKEIDNRIEIVKQRIKDGNLITSRIEKTASEAGIAADENMSYLDILEEFRKRLVRNAEALQKRSKIIKQIKEELRPMQRRIVANLKKARQAEQDLLRRYGVKKPDDLRALNQRHREHRRLLQQEQSVQRELDAAIGGFCEEEIIGKILLSKNENKLDAVHGSISANTHSDISQPELSRQEILKKLLDNTLAHIKSVSDKLTDEVENRGRILEQMRQIAEDKTQIRKQRELAIVDEKIRLARTEWQIYAVCARMLDEIRVTYERDRQPRTLAEASEFLKRLTDEKYHRIWTPLGEETLLLDDKDGNTFEISWLSRGTREQVFIALRLALASEFARHGSILPLVLDDVLVNFDSLRALAAAQLLLDFASTGRQIFLFTCHEHICRMFQKLDVPVRILPRAEEPEKIIRVLLPLSVLEHRRKRRLRKQRRLEREAEQQRLAAELSEREEEIRLDAVRRAEVQRLVVEMQQQATAEKAYEAEQQKRE